jgi:hypothetical protein
VNLRRRWYLVGWDRGREDWRTFRVDRLGPLAATEVHAAGAAGFGCGRYVEPTMLAARRSGVGVEGLLLHTYTGNCRPGLVLGHARLAEPAIERGRWAARRGAFRNVSAGALPGP